MSGDGTTPNEAAEPHELEAYDLTGSPCNLIKRALKRACDLFIEEAGDAGLRPQQFIALIEIYQNPGITQNDLVKLTGSDRSTIAELIARMAARGDLIRKRDKRDQRVNRIFLTEGGIRVLRRALPGVVRAERLFFELIAPESRDSFIASLRALGEDDRIAAPAGPVASQ